MTVDECTGMDVGLGATPPSLREDAARGVLWSSIQRWGNQATGFVVFALLARLLGPEAFGLVAMANVFLAFVETFLDRGFSTPIVQRSELEPEHLDTAFWVGILLGLIMAFLGIAGAGLVAGLFDEPELAPVVRWLSASFFLLALGGVQEALLKRNLDFQGLAVRSLAAVVIGGVVGVAMALAGFGVWSLVGRQLVVSGLYAAFLWWSSDWRPGIRVTRRHFREIGSFGANVVGINLLGFLNRHSDDFLIGMFLGKTALGYYDVAYRLLLVMTRLLTSVTSQVALPAFAKLQTEPTRIRRAFYTVTQLTSLAAFPAFAGMAVLAPELVTVVFGAQWLPSVPVMRVLALIGALHSVFYFNSSVIIAMGKPGWQFRITALSAVLNVIGFAIAVRFGIVAVAIAYVVRGYVVSPIPLWAISRLIDIDVKTYLRRLSVPAIGSIAMAAAVAAVRQPTANVMSTELALASSIAIGMVVYGAFVLVIAPDLVRQVMGFAQIALPRRPGP